MILCELAPCVIRKIDRCGEICLSGGQTDYCLCELSYHCASLHLLTTGCPRLSLSDSLSIL